MYIGKGKSAKWLLWKCYDALTLFFPNKAIEGKKKLLKAKKQFFS